MRRKKRKQAEIENNAGPPTDERTSTPASVGNAPTQDVWSIVQRLSQAQIALEDQKTNHRKAMAGVLLSILDVLDAFQRVFASVSEKQDQTNDQVRKWLGNFRTIQKMLLQVLSDQNVTQIRNSDQGFDPQWHKAVEVIEDPARPDGTIVDEVRAGYLWRGSLLRKTEVVVTRCPSSTEGGAVFKSNDDTCEA